MYPNTYDSASALVARGLQLASYDGWRVTPQDPTYWRDRPDEAVCLVTGPRSGIVVVALDSDLIVWTRYRQLRQGVLARLDLPPTLMLRTSSGRRSVFYRVSGATGRGLHAVGYHPFVDPEVPIAEAPGDLRAMLGRGGAR